MKKLCDMCLNPYYITQTDAVHRKARLITMKDLLIDYLSQHIELNEAEKAFLVSLDIFRSVKKGKTLLRAGDHSNVGYFVLKGCIRVYYLVDGEEKTTAFYTEMQGVTPTCVNTEQASDYTIDCVEDSLLLMSSPSLETETFAQFPKFESLCRILSEQQIAEKQTEFDKFKILSPEARYQSMLQNNPKLIARVPQHQLASFLGITPQSLSRIKTRIKNKESHR